MTEEHPKRRPRRFLQFSLRSLLIFVLLVSIGMSWLGVKLERARRQREAVRVIEDHAEIAYDYEFGNGSGEPSVPKWARELFGDDFFFDVVEVWRIRGDFSDDEARHLKVLTDLGCLGLSGTQLTDAGLEHLKGLTSLEILDLSHTKITDAGLEHLEGLARLQHLDLSNTQITDAGLEHLKGLANLRYLRFSRTPVTDAGLEHLTGLTSLVYLEPKFTQVTDGGLDELQDALPECRIYHEYWTSEGGVSHPPNLPVWD